MENRIKEQQLDLFADRTSAATLRANPLRLYLSSAAYMLMHALRRLGLKDTAMGPCCMDHPEGCLIIVFFNTGDNLDAT